MLLIFKTGTQKVPKLCYYITLNFQTAELQLWMGSIVGASLIVVTMALKVIPLLYLGL